ncbi:MAG TPA: hypothetical protein VFW75_01715 [Acetobacteraceae bacterium]|nr:hypothetical protein [Acetobacteraceae bacterium]
MIQQHRFRAAADAVTAAFASFATVEAIALIGSVAKPIRRERTRVGWLAHYCKDLDLAVWITGLHELDALRRARNRAAGRLFEQTGVGGAVHEIEAFLLEPGSNRYLGRLCRFRECPAHKLECLVEGCGRMPFLR